MGTEGSVIYLVAALAIVWLAIIGYLVMLGGRLGTLRREHEALKAQASQLDDDSSTP